MSVYPSSVSSINGHCPTPLTHIGTIFLWFVYTMADVTERVAWLFVINKLNTISGSCLGSPVNQKAFWSCTLMRVASSIISVSTRHRLMTCWPASVPTSPLRTPTTTRWAHTAIIHSFVSYSRLGVSSAFSMPLGQSQVALIRCKAAKVQLFEVRRSTPLIRVLRVQRSKSHNLTCVMAQNLCGTRLRNFNASGSALTIGLESKPHVPDTEIVFGLN